MPAIVIAAALCSLCIWLQFFFRDSQHPPEAHTITLAKARVEVAERRGSTKPPYLKDAFPGGRHVRTVYGTIQVFEWGPSDGEKVLMLHGLGTPCIALSNMARGFVEKGCRVMLFKLFGRGYSDAPNDLRHDARLYTSQILLVLASSPLSWAGSSAFHIVGFSLGGSIAAGFAAYHAHMLRSMTLICPGGLIRKSHISCRDRILYSRGIPQWARLKLLRRDLEPRAGTWSMEERDKTDEAGIDFDEVPIAMERPWFIASYLSTVQSSLVYGRHDQLWRDLGEELRRRQSSNPPPGLSGGRICLILAEDDVIVVKDELIEDAQRVPPMATVDTFILKGGHEIAISRGKDMVTIAMQNWR
ncbi:putative alpha/beta fold family hydrolase [Westerdykella ornata]|uniref:Putative alpha/beta fold family hydrolase n=1 Tax=Westerdykella ornata TaxID=318751 RepID=A0A6A6J7T7_WESOR|nr:putative alpha/beta fold family hydrolase [Westerdykella ornata]KAF2272621.1 putative alpha/beta fold family hydrolase [Westerdykella ornata]